MVGRLLRAIWLIPILLAPAYAWGDELVVTANHDTIGRDQTVLLAVRHNGSDADFTVDTSSLQKNFYVVPKGSGHQAGKWLEKRFQLGPKHTGVLQVPALSITVQGKILSSQPFRLTVLNKTGDVDDTRLWIETHVDRASAWQRQQIIYRFSVFSTNDMVSPRLSPPDFHGFQVEALQENAQQERVMNGRRVQVSNYRYLLFPQQSGDLRIVGPTMHATLVQTEKSQRIAAGQASFGDERHILRQKAVQGAGITIHIRPLPLAARELPVGRLKLSSGISEGHGVAGEPLTWTVKVRGEKMLAISLPDLKRQMHISKSFKTYPETPDISLKKSAGEALASAIWRVVVLPQASGEMSLPPIEVPYFDPDKGRIETAVAKTIEVRVSPARQAQDAVVFRSDPSHRMTNSGVIRGIAGWWEWLAVAFFLLWIVTLAIWLLPVRKVVALLRGRRKKQPGVRWVASAADSLDQFRRIKRFLGVPESLSPLGLLDLIPGLEGSEAGRWLEAIEKSRYASGTLPPPLDTKPVRQIRDMARCSFGAADEITAPEDFGRIGPRRRTAVAAE